MPWFWGVLLEFNNGWLFISEQKMQQSFERYEVNVTVFISSIVLKQLF